MRSLSSRRLAGASLLALAAAAPAAAEGRFFERIASFPVARNLPVDADSAAPTSAEIITASGDGNTLVYSDSPGEGIGFIDITDAAAPAALGHLAMGGEPTSVSAAGGTVFVGVNTSPSFTEPSGRLAAVDIATRSETASCDLGGQPDSVAVAPSGRFVAVAVENERDEDVADGALPQLPGGFVAIVPLADGALDCDGLVRADLAGLAVIAPEDPEPEFVDVNADDEIAATLQENNHIVILGRDGSVTAHFSAGSVDLDGIDTEDDGALAFDGSKQGVVREPDAVQWIGTDRIAVANEGDWNGGSRGFTIFGRDGKLLHEEGAALERAIAAVGHYPDGRSDAKGVEPEGLEFARFADGDRLFVLTERASIVGVYRLEDGRPVLDQLLPSGISPEGGTAIPARDLFVAANEVDLVEDGGVRSHVMIFALRDGEAAPYPTLTSAGSAELIGWGAISGLAADPAAPGRLHAVSDSVYDRQPSIFEIDATVTPARITRMIPVTRDGAPAEKLDLEGITADGQGGFWLASEGDAEKEVPHQLLHVDGSGAIDTEVPLPEALVAGGTRFGTEGIALAGDTLWIAMQREWKDDPKGTAKLLAYEPASGTWSGVRYPLETPAEGRWVGLSDIAAHDGALYLVERDNGVAEAGKVKLLTRVDLEGLDPAPLGGDLPLVTKTVVRDLLPDLEATRGYVSEKVEGLAVDAAGNAFIVTDNDGVDDNSGETWFLSLGSIGAM